MCADTERFAQGRRALLAEDNLINQRVAQKMLTNLGLVCEVACNGQEAVTLAEKGATDGKPFDVVLMDMAMPVMGGVEASRVGSQRTPHILILYPMAHGRRLMCPKRCLQGESKDGRDVAEAATLLVTALAVQDSANCSMQV